MAEKDKKDWGARELFDWGYRRSFGSEKAGKYADYLRNKRDKEGIMSAWKSMWGDVGTLAKNVAYTTPDVIGAGFQMIPRAFGYEYTPKDPGGFAQQGRKNEITPFNTPAGVAPWLYSKLGGIPKFTKMGDTTGWGGATKMLGGEILGVDAIGDQWKNMMDKSDDLMYYYHDWGTDENPLIPEGFKEYEKGHWSDAKTRKLEGQYGKELNEDEVYGKFMDQLMKDAGEGYEVSHIFNDPNPYYQVYKEKVKTNWLNEKKAEELMPGYTKHFGNEYRKTLVDEFGMYPFDPENKQENIIDYGDGNKVYLADPDYLTQEHKEGKVEHMAYPSDWDFGIFEPMISTDWTPHSYGSDEAAEFFEQGLIRLPAEFAIPMGATKGSKVLPKGFQSALKQAMPITFGHPSKWRKAFQFPTVIGGSEFASDRYDHLIR